MNNVASGEYSHAHGYYTETINTAEAAFGQFNKSTEGSTIFSIGDGDSANSRHNIVEVTRNGVNINNKLNVEDNLKVDGATTLNGPVTLGDTEQDAITVNGDTNFKADVDIDKSLNVDGNTTIGGTLGVSSNTTIGGTLDVTGATTLNGAVTLGDAEGDTITVNGDTNFKADVDIDKTLNVDENTTIGGTLGVDSNTTIGGTLGVTGATTLGGTLGVDSNTTIGGSLDVSGATTLEGTLEVNGATTLNGSLDVSGATTIGGTLGVDFNTTIGGTLGVDSNTTIGGTLGVTGATTLEGTLEVNGATYFETKPVVTPSNDPVILESELNSAKESLEGQISSEKQAREAADTALDDKIVIIPSDGDGSGVMKGAGNSASGKNSFAIGQNNKTISENSVTLGNQNLSGIKGYSYKHIDFDDDGKVSVFLRSDTLSSSVPTTGDSKKPSIDTTIESGYEINDILYISDGLSFYTASVTEVEHNRISFDSETFPFKKFIVTSGRFYVYCVDKPTTGVFNLGPNSLSEGLFTKAIGVTSHAEGYNNIASGACAHAEGSNNKANSENSHAEGRNNTVYGHESHIEGSSNTVSGNCSHVEGFSNRALGDKSHVEGSKCVAYSHDSHAEGYGSAAGDLNQVGLDASLRTDSAAHAEGARTVASGIGSHSEGSDTLASGVGSHAEGIGTYTRGYGSHTEGVSTKSGVKGFYIKGINFSGKRLYLSKTQVTPIKTTGFDASDLENIDIPWVVGDTVSIVNGKTYNNIIITQIKNNTIFVESLPFTKIARFHDLDAEIDPIEYSIFVPDAYKLGTVDLGFGAHAEGKGTRAFGHFSNASGMDTHALGAGSHAEGYKTTVNGDFSHAEGYANQIDGSYSHAEGYDNIVYGDYSHAEGIFTTASGECSHVEGYYTTASGSYSHAEGFQTNASGKCSHVEGYYTIASGDYSKAGGQYTIASGDYSKAGGQYTTASGNCSIASGWGLEDYRIISSGKASFASGYCTEAKNTGEFACGKFNTSTSGKTLFSVGCGTKSTKKNAIEVTTEQTIINNTLVLNSTDRSFLTLNSKTIYVDNETNDELPIIIEPFTRHYVYLTRNGSAFTLYFETSSNHTNEEYYLIFDKPIDSFVDLYVNPDGPSDIYWANGISTMDLSEYNVLEVCLCSYNGNSSYLGTVSGYKI